MEKIIWKNCFKIREEIKMRQIIEIQKISEQFVKKEIDEATMWILSLLSMIESVNGTIISSDWLLDNLDISEFTELSKIISEKINEFSLKKKNDLNTNTKLSWTAESETSHTNGKK